MKRNKKEENLNDLLDSMQEVLEGLKESLLENLKEIPKPKFKIIMESDKNGEGYKLEVEGNKPSLLLALSSLVDNLLNDTDLTKEEIQEAINFAFEENEED